MASADAARSSLICSPWSREVGEPLVATAPRADVWLLLEYAGRWGNKAFEESALPEPLKAHLNAQLEAIPESRLVFVKRGASRDLIPVHFFVADARPPQPRLYAFELESLDSLLDLDITAVAAGDPAYDGQRRLAPLFLVCGNGKRDACCAKFGIAAYQAMTLHAGQDAWQTTHVGGHRFAPVMLFLPHALSYGRAAPDEVETLVDAYRRGEVVLDRYRGRTSYPPPAQAAEYYLRLETGITAINDLQLVDVQPLAGDEWLIRLEVAGGAVHALRVASEPLLNPIYTSCADAAPGPGSTFRLVEHDVTAPGI